MAHAVQDVFKGAKVTIGPSIEDRFYYDFEYSETFTLDDFEKDRKAHEEALPITRLSGKRCRGKKPWRFSGRRVKITKLNSSTICLRMFPLSVFTEMVITSICAGGLIFPQQVKSRRLNCSAAGHWRGDEKNKMLSAFTAPALPTGSNEDY